MRSLDRHRARVSPEAPQRVKLAARSLKERIRYNGPTPQARNAHLKFKDLLSSWQHGAGSPRTATEYAVRLPLDDAARLAALAELFPGRTREQIITDLLGVALQEVAAAIPYVPGPKVISSDEQGDPLYEDAGLTPRLIELTRKYRKRLEAELEKP